jgi:hypothetical protein
MKFAQNSKAKKSERKLPSIWEGNFISLQSFAEALSGGERYADIASACNAYDVAPARSPSTQNLADLVDVGLDEMRALLRLYRVCMDLHARVSPDAPPDSTISPGFYARGLMRQA